MWEAYKVESCTIVYMSDFKKPAFLTLVVLYWQTHTVNVISDSQEGACFWQWQGENKVTPVLLSPDSPVFPWHFPALFATTVLKLFSYYGANSGSTDKQRKWGEHQFEVSKLEHSLMTWGSLALVFPFIFPVLSLSHLCFFLSRPALLLSLLQSAVQDNDTVFSEWAQQRFPWQQPLFCSASPMFAGVWELCIVLPPHHSDIIGTGFPLSFFYWCSYYPPLAIIVIWITAIWAACIRKCRGR